MKHKPFYLSQKYNEFIYYSIIIQIINFLCPLYFSSMFFFCNYHINLSFFFLFLFLLQNWELMNTAVLTGRQVSQAMKVFTVSQAGKVTDVTRNSICNTEDERVIKVSDSFNFHNILFF